MIECAASMSTTTVRFWPSHNFVGHVLQEEEMAEWETEKEAEMQRLKRHQRVLDKQSRALLKLPNRKERSEVHINVPLSGLQVRVCTRQCQDALACAS